MEVIEEEEEEGEEEDEEEEENPQEPGITSPIFDVELKPVSVMTGEEIYLYAVVKGVPQPHEVSWKHNGTLLRHDITDANIFYVPESGVCELTISEAFIEDAGVYEIEAANQYGIAVSQTEVLVRGFEETQPELSEAVLVEVVMKPEEVPTPIPVIPTEQAFETREEAPVEGGMLWLTLTSWHTKADISIGRSKYLIEIPDVIKKPTQEELIEKDKEYEFKVGVKGKPGERKPAAQDLDEKEIPVEEVEKVIQPKVPVRKLSNLGASRRRCSFDMRWIHFYRMY